MGEPHRPFVSTRGGARYTFREAVLAGWADDGGMILPEKLPKVTREMLASWRGLAYPQLVHELLVLFLDEEIPGLQGMINEAFATFSTHKVVEFRALGRSAEDVQVAELFHGPSLAFKDLGMQVLAKLIEHYLGQSGTDMTFLVGTSGDTGPSALEAVRGKAGLRLIVLYPLGRVSPTQEAQMLRAHGLGGNCRVVAVEGTSDDLDEPVTHLFADRSFRTQHRLGSLNSVNIVRLVVQVFHYFYAYLHLTRDSPAWTTTTSSQPLPRVSFAIPTGAAGHVTAGVMAALMGLPVHRLLMATNENDILSRMVGEGVLEKKGAVVPTNSPAMDIQAPYNVERIFHMLWPEDDGPPDGQAIGGMMESFYRGEAVPINDHILGRLRGLGVCCESVGKGRGAEGVLGTIEQVYRDDGYLLDPHTAVGVAAARRLAAKGGLAADDGSLPPVVCMGCAHPAKFAPTIAEALGMKEPEAVDLIARQSHPSVGATLNLVETLKTGGMQVQCPRFYETDRAQWSTQLREMIVELE